PSLRHLRDTETHALVGCQTGQALAATEDRAIGDIAKTGDRIEDGALARSVRTDDRRNAFRRHLKTDRVQCLDLPVRDTEAFDLEIDHRAVPCSGGTFSTVFRFPR